MKASELSTEGTPYVETDTDSLLHWNEIGKRNFIAKYGDIELFLDESQPFKRKYYRVPSLDAKRNEYMKAKTRDCAIWGCE